MLVAQEVRNWYLEHDSVSKYTRERAMSVSIKPGIANFGWCGFADSVESRSPIHWC
jgi:hypothetical protein